MSYENAIATKLLATNCIVCGRALVDARSIEMGIGPECAEHMDGGIEEDIRKIANEHVFHASIAATLGKVEEVMQYAQLVDQLGLHKLAEAMKSRFVNAKKHAVIEITEENGMLHIRTPYRRKDSDVFIQAWRNIPGRRWMSGSNVVPIEQKPAVWEVLKKFFAGKYAMGPKGIFRVPRLVEQATTSVAAKVIAKAQELPAMKSEPQDEQLELHFQE